MNDTDGRKQMLKPGESTGMHVAAQSSLELVDEATTTSSLPPHPGVLLPHFCAPHGGEGARETLSYVHATDGNEFFLLNR